MPKSPSATTLRDGPMRKITDHVEHFSAFGFRAAKLTCGHEQVYKVKGQDRIRCDTCQKEGKTK